MRFKEFSKLPVVEEVLVVTGETTFERLDESDNWITGRFDRNIRIDQPTHGVGKTHAHILGRKGDELGVVNIDGTASHGTKMRLSAKDAGALRAKGFKIAASNIVEWLVLGTQPTLLLG